VIFSTVKDGGNLYTEKEYGDFILRFRLQADGQREQRHRHPRAGEGDAAYVGMEIQVLDDSGSAYQKLQPYQYHGSIYDLVACKRGFQKPVGEWNEEEIQAKGRQIKVTLNGTVIVDANLDDIKDEGKLKKHPGISRTKGFIGFLGHGAASSSGICGSRSSRSRRASSALRSSVSFSVLYSPFLFHLRNGALTHSLSIPGCWNLAGSGLVYSHQRDRRI
jgi:hypothetical protein